MTCNNFSDFPEQIGVIRRAQNELTQSEVASIQQSRTRRLPASILSGSGGALLPPGCCQVISPYVSLSSCCFWASCVMRGSSLPV